MVKVVLPYTPRRLRRGADVALHLFLTEALEGGEWSASRPDPFTPCERVSGTH